MSVPDLSPTEEQIVVLFAAGLSASEVADAVGLGEQTVEWHLVRAARKLETATTLQQQVRRAVESTRSRRRERRT